MGNKRVREADHLENFQGEGGLVFGRLFRWLACELLNFLLLSVFWVRSASVLGHSTDGVDIGNYWYV